MYYTKIALSFQKDSETMSIQELWQSIHDLAGGRVADNIICGEYYLDVREYQTVTLRALLEALEDTHLAARTKLKPD